MWFERWRYLLPLRLQSILRVNRVDAELDEEIRYHLEQQIALNIARGMTPDEARTMARRAMGGVEQWKEACRDERRWTFVDTTLRDVRYGLRVLRRSPMFAAVAVCSLALGIGANAAIFQLIDVIRLRSLPVVNPHELAEVRVAGVRNFGISDGFAAQMTYPLWEQIRDHQSAFSDVFAWGRTGFLAGRGVDAQRVNGLWVSGRLFDALGVTAERGRLLTESDDRRGCGAGPVVVSHAFWQRQFGGDESVVGRTITLLDKPFTVVGVTPPQFTGLEVGREFDVAVPVCSAALWGNSLDRRDFWWLTVMGRLKTGWTLEQASEQVRTLSPELLQATLPSGYSAEDTSRYLGFRFTALSASRGVSSVRTGYGTSLWLLLGMTGLVLLITCGNLATLMLARASAREREITVRVALGASRRRIVSQVLVESLLVAAAGAVLAIPVALVSSRALVAFLTTDANAIHLDLGLDWRIIAFIALVAGLTSLLFGLAPASSASMVDPNRALRQVSRGLTVDRRRASFQRVLVVGQIAVSLVLVVSALLFGRSFQNLIGVDTGFQQDGILFVSFVDLASANLPLEQRIEFQQRLTEEIRQTPGVAAAASSTIVPLSGSGWSHSFRVLSSPGDARQGSRFTYVSPSYFDTLDIPILSGRGFDSDDTASGRRVLLVNEAFVKQTLQGGDPIGVTLRTFSEPGYPETTYEIVGTVRDTKYGSLREETQAIAYVPIAQHPALRPWVNVIVRTSTPAVSVVPEIRRRVSSLNSGIALQVTELKSQVRGRLAGERMLAWLAGSFGVLSITLASIGLYGVIAYLASGRRNEIGIRLSLGSSRLQVIRLMLRDSVWLLAVGLIIGLPVSVAVMRGVSALLFGLSPTNIPLLLGATGVLAVATGLAACIPAWRASRLDPAVALRCD